MRIDPTQFAPGIEIREYDPARDSHAVRERLMASSRISLSRTRIAAEVSADPFCTKREARARQAGARSLQLSVKAGNTGARSLYTAEGFVESAIYLEKPLTRPGAPADQQANEGDVD
jgi:hypothetical protein